MSRFLIVSNIQIFPNQSGSQSRVAGLAQALAKQGHEVQIYALTGRKADYQARRPSADGEVGPGIREYVNRNWFWAGCQWLAYSLKLPPLFSLLALAGRRPKGLRQQLAAADVLVLDFPFVTPVARGFGGLVVFSSHNVEADFWQRTWFHRRLVRPLVVAAERRAVAVADCLWGCAAADLQQLVGATPNKPCFLIANGVAAAAPLPADARKLCRHHLGIHDHQKVLIFLASKFGPNWEAFIWLRQWTQDHRAWLKDAGMVVVVVGSVAAATTADEVFKTTGFVAEILPYLAAADLALNPIFSGSGSNVKVAYYLQARLPLLTTNFGRRGYQLTADHNCFVFDQEDLQTVLSRALALLGTSQMATMCQAAYDDNEGKIHMDQAVQQFLASPTFRAKNYSETNQVCK